MVSLLTMTGSASLIGVWVYKRWEAKEQVRQELGVGPVWWQTAWQRAQKRVWQSKQPATSHNPPRTSLPSTLPFIAPEQTPAAYAYVRYGWHTSTLALAVTTSGMLTFPPLQLVGLPLLIYMGIPAAQQAYEQLWVDGRPSRALAETVALVACLAGGYYWVGSLGFWLYYGSRTWLAAKQPPQVAHSRPWLTPATARLWKEGSTCAVPIATLQPGDQVLLHSGDMTPVDGLITQGMAWLRPHALSAAACGLRKGVGDKVTATDIVLVGQIRVRMLPAT